MDVNGYQACEQKCNKFINYVNTEEGKETSNFQTRSTSFSSTNSNTKDGTEYARIGDNVRLHFNDYDSLLSQMAPLSAQNF